MGPVGRAQSQLLGSFLVDVDGRVSPPHKLPTSYNEKKSHSFRKKKKTFINKKAQNGTSNLFCKFTSVPSPHIFGILSPPPSHRTLTHTAAFHAGSATFMVDIRPRSVPKAMAGHRAVHRSRFECCPEQCRPRVPLDLYPLFRVGVCPADTVTNSYI